MPSAKYSCCGSLAVNGSTTIDCAGTLGKVPCPGGDAIGARAWTTLGCLAGTSCCHSANSSAAHKHGTASAATYQAQGLLLASDRGSSLGKPAILSGPSASIGTGMAMFLSVCSPRFSKG